MELHPSCLLCCWEVQWNGAHLQETTEFRESGRICSCFKAKGLVVGLSLKEQLAPCLWSLLITLLISPFCKDKPNMGLGKELKD